LQGYVFLLIFKMMTMTVWFGLFNGLCLVPTILSLVGPQPAAIQSEDSLDDSSESKTPTAPTTCPQFDNKVIAQL
jgi:hypothetical protein